MIYNYILICAIVSWCAAQIIKTVINSIKKGKFCAERLVGSGGMPSSHTALVVAGLVATERIEGFGSPLFAIMFILSGIVIYDAMNVRYAAGLHAKELNRINSLMEQLPEILKLLSGTDDDRKKLKEYLGHTPYEVLGGLVLGIVIPWIIPIK